MTEFWANTPPGEVIHLPGASRETLLTLPPAAPAVVVCRPLRHVSVRALLDEMERSALELFPAWLPGVELIEGPGGMGVAAARSLAHRHAADTSHHGPFLADLAERAIRARPTSVVFPDAVRAVGLARVVASGAGRTGVALIIEIQAGLSPDAERALVSAAQRVASLGRINAWLVAAELRATDVTVVRLGDEPSVVPHFPPAAGLPHPSSMVEQALEAALCRRAWAAGRQWNQTHRIHTLANPIRPDLVWTAERVIVEIDGPEHYDPDHFAADRRRDVDLQLAGYAVLRFTNADVKHDVGAVVARIERFITERRKAA